SKGISPPSRARLQSRDALAMARGRALAATPGIAARAVPIPASLLAFRGIARNQSTRHALSGVAGRPFPPPRARPASYGVVDTKVGYAPVFFGTARSWPGPRVGTFVGALGTKQTEERSDELGSCRRQLEGVQRQGSAEVGQAHQRRPRRHRGQAHAAQRPASAALRRGEG